MRTLRSTLSDAPVPHTPLIICNGNCGIKLTKCSNRDARNCLRRKWGSSCQRRDPAGESVKRLRKRNRKDTEHGGPCQPSGWSPQGTAVITQLSVHTHTHRLTHRLSHRNYNISFGLKLTEATQGFSFSQSFKKHFLPVYDVQGALWCLKRWRYLETMMANHRKYFSNTNNRKRYVCVHMDVYIITFIYKEKLCISNMH